MAGIDSVGPAVDVNRLIKGCMIDDSNLGHVDIMGIVAMSFLFIYFFIMGTDLKIYFSFSLPPSVSH
jgi:hypothetical protein